MMNVENCLLSEKKKKSKSYYTALYHDFNTDKVLRHCNQCDPNQTQHNTRLIIQINLE